MRRPEFLTSTDCLLCSGAGVLVLGRRLCQGVAIGGRFPPAVVARAVEFAVDLVAEQSMAAGLDRAAARAEIADLVAELRRLGLLAAAPTVAVRSGPRWQPATIEGEAIAAEPAPVPDQCVEVSPSVPGFPWGAWLLVA